MAMINITFCSICAWLCLLCILQLASSMQGQSWTRQCTKGFPSMLKPMMSSSGPHRDRSISILIPEMNFTCDSTIMSLEVVGMKNGNNNMHYPRLQIWRKDTHEQGMYYKVEDSDIVLNPSAATCIPDDMNCRGKKTFIYTQARIKINSGDILGFQLPPSSMSGFEIFTRSSPTLNSYVYDGPNRDPLCIDLSDVSSMIVQHVQPQIKLQGMSTMSSKEDNMEFKGMSTMSSKEDNMEFKGSCNTSPSVIAPIVSSVVLLVIIVLIVVIAVLLVKRRKVRTAQSTLRAVEDKPNFANPMYYNKHLVEGSIDLPPTPANIAGDYAEIADEPCSEESSNSHMTTDVKSSEKYEPKADDNRPDITGSNHYYFTLTQECTGTATEGVQMACDHYEYDKNLKQHTADETSDDDTYWEPADSINELYKQMSTNKYREIAPDEVK